MRQTVILAAGSGSRLLSARGDVPKPLMAVGGIPLVVHGLQHAKDSGCDEAIVVVGYQGDRVQSAIEAMQTPLRTTFVWTADPAAPNGVSLLSAEPAAHDVFYLQMVDHLFAVPALDGLVRRPLEAGEAGRVLVDSSPTSDIDLDDATKVCVRNGRVTAIGKGLTAWDAVDAGCFVLTHAVFDALRAVPAGEPLSVSSGMRQLASSGSLGAVDLCGASWVDVDTPADRLLAERLIERRPVSNARY